MSVENAAEFMIKIGEDSSLEAQLENINSPQELALFAQQQGYEVSPEDITAVGSVIESESGELSEEQLEAVAGGFFGAISAALSIGSTLFQHRDDLMRGYRSIRRRLRS